MTSDIFSLALILSENEPARISRHAEAVSEPANASYGQYLTRAALEALVALPTEERQTIAAWLESNGMEVVDAPGISRQLLHAHATPAQLVAAFGSEIEAWLQGKDDRRSLRLVSALPRRLAGYVQRIEDLPGKGTFLSFTRLTQDPLLAYWDANAASAAMPAGLGGLTPSDVRSIYHFPPEWTGVGETIALMMLGGMIDTNDLHAFWRAHQIEPPQVDVMQVGPARTQVAPEHFDLEAAMTIQWAGAMAPGARIVVYQIDPSVVGDPWAAFLLAVIGDNELQPTIASTSWIIPERKYYGANGHSVIMGLLNQAAALGITVIAAAGDWGAFDGVPRVVRDGRPVSDAPWPHAVFPAVEERVLGVGGTMISYREPLTEVGWSGPPPPGLQAALQFEQIAGSGGFSEEVPIPAWQQAHLRGFYSRGAGVPAVVPFGRGFPDVALAAAGPSVQRGEGEVLTSQGYQAVVGGRWVDHAGGTSVAAPIWAAIIARANQARRAARLPRLGCANSLLYSLRSAQPAPFREVTAGAADVSMLALNSHGRAAAYHLNGFVCQAGWDPVTGLGVPDVARLVIHLAHNETLNPTPHTSQKASAPNTEYALRR